MPPLPRPLRQELEAFGGTVEKFIGDAVMAVFGAPVAHEDDAERAVRAGLRVLQAIEELNEQARLELSVRIGINTGEVVVRWRRRQKASRSCGDVVNTAAGSRAARRSARSSSAPRRTGHRAEIRLRAVGSGRDEGQSGAGQPLATLGPDPASAPT